MKTKRILAVLLTMTIVLTLLPTFAISVNANTEPVLYDVFVTDVQVTSENASDVLGDGTVSYDADTNTITLNGANITFDSSNSAHPGVISAFTYEIPVNIVLKGENTLINSTDVPEGIDAGDGIYNLDSHLNISAEPGASLSVPQGRGAINVRELTISGGTYTFSSPVYSTDDITFDNCDISVTSIDYGINANGSIDIVNSNVLAIGGYAAFYGFPALSGYIDYEIMASENTDGSDAVKCDIADTVNYKYVKINALDAPKPEAKWGTSKDNLTYSGTLADAVYKAGNDSSITYIELQKNVSVTGGYVIGSGVFTLDLNGKTLTGGDYPIDVRGSGTVVTLTDTAGDGSAISTTSGGSVINAMPGGKVVIDGGSYNGGIDIKSGSVVIINRGTFNPESKSYSITNLGSLTINGGDIKAGNMSSVYTADGSETKVTGGSFATGHYGTFIYSGGLIDLSEWSDASGTKIYMFSDNVTVSDETIRLPAGLSVLDANGTAQTTLNYMKSYTVGKEGSDTTGGEAEITSITFNSDSPLYDSKTNTFYIDYDNPLKLTINGKNMLDKGMKPFFANTNYDALSAFLTATDNESFYFVIDKDYYQLIIDAFIAYGYEANIAYVGICFADENPTMDDLIALNVAERKPNAITVDSSIINGTVTSDKTTAAIGDTVTLTVTPDEGYVLDTLIVSDTENTIEAIKGENDTYTFTMPAGAVTVTATFRSTNVTYGDVNGDGEVDVLDRTELVRYLAKRIGYENINTANADVNGDGIVNGFDRAILARYFAKWAGYETLPHK